MTDDATKKIAPPYVSIKTLNTFFNKLRDDKDVPNVIDRSFLRSFNGAAQNEIQLALRFFGFTTDSNGVLPLLSEYALATDEDRRLILRRVALEKYSFALSDPVVNIEKATTNQVAELFRARNLSGSTLSRAIALFLAICTEVGIKTPSYLKPPAIQRDTSSKKKKAPSGPDASTQTMTSDDAKNPDIPRPLNFEIPIPNKPSVRISIPADFDADDWELLTAMFQAYVKRWKALP